MPRPTTTSGRAPLTLERAAVAALLAVLPVTGLVFWRGLGEPFHLVKLTLGAGLAVVALALWSLDSIRRDRTVLPPSSILVGLGAFLVALVLSVVLSETPMTSLVGTYTVRGGFATYGAAIVVFLVASSTFDRRRATTLLVVATGTLAVATAYALLQAAHGDPFTWLRESTVFSTFGNNDFASGWLGATLPLAIGAALVLPRDWRRWAATAVAVATAVAIPLTKSFQGLPTALVGAAVVLVAWYLSAPERRGKVGPYLAGTGRRVGIAAVVVVVVAVVAAVSWSELRHGMLERRYFWRAALHVAGHHPVVGTGLDTFATEFFRARPVGHALRFTVSSAEAPHNVPLAMLANGGIVLLVTYLAVVVAVGAAFLRGLRTTDGPQRVLVAAFAGSWLAYQVQSLVSIDVPALVFLHWLVAGVGVAIAVPDRRLVYLGRRSERAGMGVRAIVGSVVVTAVAVVALVLLSRPIRADRDVVEAVNEARTGADGAAMALRHLNSAIDLAGWEPTYRLAMSSFLSAGGNPAAAAEAVTRATQLDPGRPQYRLAAAELEAQIGAKRDAIRQFRAALRVDPHNPQVLSRAGLGLVRAGADDDGVQALQRATELQPQDGRAWFDLGTGLKAAGRPGDAADAFARAHQLNPTLEPPS